jgi:hypothetical protein
LLAMPAVAAGNQGSSSSSPQVLAAGAASPAAAAAAAAAAGTNSSRSGPSAFGAPAATIASSSAGSSSSSSRAGALDLASAGSTALSLFQSLPAAAAAAAAASAAAGGAAAGAAAAGGVERLYDMREFTAATRRLVLLHQKLAEVSGRWETDNFYNKLFKLFSCIYDDVACSCGTAVLGERSIFSRCTLAQSTALHKLLHCCLSFLPHQIFCPAGMHVLNTSMPCAVRRIL